METQRSPQTSRQGGVTVVSLGPEYENLDESALEGVRSAILAAAVAADPPLVVLDLSHTKFFGSACIEILFRSWNRINGRPGGRFAISGLTPYCAEVIQVTHLDRLWSIYATHDEAAAALNSTVE